MDIVSAFGVNDNQQLAAMGASERDKAFLLSGVRRVRNGQRERIGEHSRTFIETDAVLPRIRFAFLSSHPKLSCILRDHGVVAYVVGDVLLGVIRAHLLLIHVTFRKCSRGHRG